MALLNLSVKHGQPRDVALVNFEQGITEAGAKFAPWVRRVEWSADRSRATLFAPGFQVEMWVDDHEVHARGDLPAFFQLFEGRLKAFLKETFPGQLPKT